MDTFVGFVTRLHHACLSHLSTICFKDILSPHMSTILIHEFFLQNLCNISKPNLHNAPVGNICSPYTPLALLNHICPHISQPHMSFTSLNHMSLTYLNHICLSHLSTTYVFHISQPHISITSLNHICLSHLSTTYIYHISQPHMSFTSLHHICLLHLSTTFVQPICF